MRMGTNGVMQGNFHEHPHEFYQMAILLRLYSADSSADILLKIRMPLEDDMMVEVAGLDPPYKRVEAG